MTSTTLRFASLSLVTFSLALASGCAAPAADEASSDEAAQTSEIRTAKTDAQIKAELEAAAVGAVYTSESDYGFHFVSAPAPQGTITQALVRKHLASFVDADPDADKPLASLYGMNSTFPNWKKLFERCSPDESPSTEDCAKIQKLNAALAKNLKGIKVFYFGRNGSAGNVEGVGVSILIVGRTPSGALAGVRTLAIWT
jgi:hypothetical protein